MQITVLSCWYPYPADNGAKIRVSAIIRSLAAVHDVDLIVLDRQEGTARDPGSLSAFCRSIEMVAVNPYLPRTLRARLAFLGRLPRSLVAAYTPAVTNLLKRRIAEGRCDVILCACADPRPAMYGLKLAKHVPVIIDELEPSRYIDAYQHAPKSITWLRKWMMWRKYRALARALLRDCAGCFVTSEKEATLLRGFCKRDERIVVVRNGVTLAHDRSIPESRDAYRLVYNGSPTYIFNLDAVTYFATEILPLIRVRAPQAWLAVTGDIAGVPLEAFAGRGDIMFTGWLPDIRSYVAESGVCVVPLRYGGGTRLKILEAMALGTPVVATTKGAEGLDVTPGEDILIANHPAAFADAVLRLMTDSALYARIAARARETVATHYDWDAIGEAMRDAFEALVKDAQQDTRLIPPSWPHRVPATERGRL